MKNPKNNMEYPIKCTICRQWQTVEVDPEQFKAWNSGVLIQKAFPDMSADDRELLRSQTCAKCYNAMFADDELDESFRIIDEANGDVD